MSRVILTNHPLVESVAAHWPAHAWRGATVLVAVSGGADSVALLQILSTLGPSNAARIVAAHFDHRLRGEASAADAAFVAELCQGMNVPLEAGAAGVAELAVQRGDGLEAAAREARYAFLAQAALQVGARFIATAHTADDQAETILHRVLRGTGLAGLAGIPRRRDLDERLTIVRPLLHVRRVEIVDYLASLEQPYCSDETNADLRFTRNRLRHELLAHLAATYNPQVAEALLRLGSLAGEAQQVIGELAGELAARCVTDAGDDRLTIDNRRLVGRPRYLVREVIIAAWRARGWPQQAMGFAEWDLLSEMLVASATSPAARQRMFPGGVTARRNGERLEVSRRAL